MPLPRVQPIIPVAREEPFELIRSHDLEGIVAKRLDDPYEPRTRWFKIKNPDYSQKEGRGELLNRPRPKI
jgi:ATP-dependent DNA ligase